MNKPILLLVDDDRAVLEALEAELAPEFAQLCRIELFGDAASMLEALPRWASERRSIAVAIVDQKMPGMSGVELLIALRRSAAETPPEAFAPARHMRVLMLTGYAGLDSAVAAKNEGRVEGYIEKPWAPDNLRRAIRRELSAYSTISDTATFHEFREIREEAEARAALALRFSVYAQTNGAMHLLPSMAEGSFDVDSFDRYSRLFGLFERSGEAEVLIGTIRVVGDDPVAIAPILEVAFPDSTILGRRLREPRTQPLPMLKYLVDHEAVAKLRDRLVAAGEDVVEPGRLALLPGYREGGALGARHLARHMIEGSVAFFFFFFRIANAILTCIPPHDAFYKPYGFRAADGTQTRFTPEINALVACLHGRIDRVPQDSRLRCEEVAMRVAWNERRGGCRCENFPTCLGSPYGTGDFSAVDLWCPELARQRLLESDSAPS